MSFKKKICIQLVRSMLEYLFWFSYQMEFAVNMTCEGCVKSVKNSLQGVEGIFTVTYLMIFRWWCSIQLNYLKQRYQYLSMHIHVINLLLLRFTFMKKKMYFHQLLSPPMHRKLRSNKSVRSAVYGLCLLLFTGIKLVGFF